jgi:hypothetical protein
MKLQLTFIILFIGLNTIAQSTFKKGYYITNDDKRHDVFFKTFGREVPKKVTYKTTLESSKFDEVSTENIKKLNIKNGVKFIRKKVAIEMLEKGMKSGKNNNFKDFILQEKELLLKVLLEFEKFTLLSYLDDKNNRYIFIKDKNELKLSVYP